MTCGRCGQTPVCVDAAVTVPRCQHKHLCLYQLGPFVAVVYSALRWPLCDPLVEALCFAVMGLSSATLVGKRGAGLGPCCGGGWRRWLRTCLHTGPGAHPLSALDSSKSLPIDTLLEPAFHVDCGQAEPFFPLIDTPLLLLISLLHVSHTCEDNQRVLAVIVPHNTLAQLTRRVGEPLQPLSSILCCLSGRVHNRRAPEPRAVSARQTGKCRAAAGAGPRAAGPLKTLNPYQIFAWQAGRRMLLLERDLAQPGP